MAGLGFAHKLKKIFGIHSKTEPFIEDLTDSLIEGDLGPKTAIELVSALEKQFSGRIPDEKTVLNQLRLLLRSFVTPIALHPQVGKVNVYMILGVNGAGKTTSAAKLAAYYNAQKTMPVILAAADTFRAAAIDQLKIHGDRLGIRVVAHKDGSDPSAVVFDAAEAATAAGGALVLADTAGRLHNKENLVRELQKIDRIAQTKASPDCYKKILVLDATSGQNALRQTEAFHEAIGVDAVVLAKYDSSARGGVAVSIGKELGIPVAFVGIGEKYTDIIPFNAEQYINEFLGIS